MPPFRTTTAMRLWTLNSKTTISKPAASFVFLRWSSSSSTGRMVIRDRRSSTRCHREQLLVSPLHTKYTVRDYQGLVMRTLSSAKDNHGTSTQQHGIPPSPKSSSNDDEPKKNLSQTSTSTKEELPPSNETKSNIKGSSVSPPKPRELLAHWMEQLRSPPNWITLTRIAATPVLSYWIITQQTWPAIIGCCVAAASDSADGYLARHCNMATTLGTYLDPLGTFPLVAAIVTESKLFYFRRINAFYSRLTAW